MSYILNSNFHNHELVQEYFILFELGLFIVEGKISLSLAYLLNKWTYLSFFLTSSSNCLFISSTSPSLKSKAKWQKVSGHTIQILQDTRFWPKIPPSSMMAQSNTCLHCKCCPKLPWHTLLLSQLGSS